MSNLAVSTIILCGAPINYAQLPIGTNHSNAMVPINGKPVIGWILDDLMGKNIRSVVVVLRSEDIRFRSFLERVYAGRLELKLEGLTESPSILTSLMAGLKASGAEGAVRIVLGDTLIRDSYQGAEDFVYVGEVKDSRRWCLVVPSESGHIIEYLDKKSVSGASHQALAGYYHLHHGDELLACVEKSIVEGQRELSFALRLYGERRPIVAKQVRDWYDFGHIDTIVDARRRLLRARSFNSLSVNPILNTITKVSKYDAKLQDELDWYLSIPDDLKVLAPRILSTEHHNGRIQIVQEYYGYPTLAELYVYGEFDSETWASILRLVLRVHQEFQRYPGAISPDALEAMYFQKTWDRLALLKEQSADWHETLSCSRITYNNRTLKGLYELREAVYSRVQLLRSNAPIAIVHGDYCFSNVLFDPNNQIIRLIDPRGRFGVKGIYGDTRYDIAKLRHSIAGLYDFIMADMFELLEQDGVYHSKIYANDVCAAVASCFDSMIAQIGYDVSDVRFIEGLLFVSMIPFHDGHPERQKIMYLTGLALLNDVLG
jgi:dTDP-glucose pyrophosphorylase